MNKLVLPLTGLLIALSGTNLTAEPAIDADVVYGHKMGMSLTYDVIRPENQNGAAIIYMVSGGWISRWSPPERLLDSWDDELDAGFTVIAVRHGSSPLFKVPDAWADVSRAVRHVRQHAAAYGIDPDRLGVTGMSAGGHLSLMLGLGSDAGDPAAEDVIERVSSRVTAVVAYFPPTDLRPLARGENPPGGGSQRFPALNFDVELGESVSPIAFVSDDDPPTLLIHGDADTLVDISASQNLVAELERTPVIFDFITIEGAGHGFRGDDAVRARAARLEWFQAHLLD
jgi:acetyl esterase/lipase